jgi:hypothetical protein
MMVSLTVGSIAADPSAWKLDVGQPVVIAQADKGAPIGNMGFFHYVRLFRDSAGRIVCRWAMRPDSHDHWQQNRSFAYLLLTRRRQKTAAMRRIFGFTSKGMHEISPKPVSPTRSSPRTSAAQFCPGLAIHCNESSHGLQAVEAIAVIFWQKERIAGSASSVGIAGAERAYRFCGNTKAMGRPPGPNSKASLRTLWSSITHNCPGQFPAGGIQRLWIGVESHGALD